MNSPDPDTETSTPSSDTPPDELMTAEPISGSMISNAIMSSVLGGSGGANSAHAKRRLGGASAQGSRDPKSRRRDEGGSSFRRKDSDMEMDGMRFMNSKQHREELVDQHLADRLRKAFGDPFDEETLKKASQ